MATWTVPAKLPYALFVAGDARLADAAQPALRRVLEALESGPPPAVALGTWIAQSGRTGTVPLRELRAQLPAEALAELGIAAEQKQRFADATHGMLIAANEAGALDARAPWGLLVLAAAMASAAAGIVYDSGTFRVLPQWILENPLDGFLLGSIKNHVVIVSSTDAAGTPSTTTLGLNKYGLFELQFSAEQQPAENVGMALAGLAQALVDARPTQPGAWDVPSEIDVSRFHVAHAYGAEVETGGGKARFALAQPPEAGVYWTVTVADRMTSVADAIRALDIGTAPDGAIDTALAQATRIARNRLSEARAAFARRALTHDVVLVKTGFATPGTRTQYVWSRVEEWDKTRMLAVVTTGLPTLEAVGIGDRVALDVADIVDWRVERRSGAALGDFSAQALRDRNAATTP